VKILIDTLGRVHRGYCGDPALLMPDSEPSLVRSPLECSA